MMTTNSSSRASLLETVSIQLDLLVWLITRRLSRQLHAFNLTLPQFAALAALSAYGESCQMGRLAHLTGQSPATLTGIVDRLLKGGWVQRIYTPTDRRRVLVQVTPAGTNLVEQIRAKFLESINENFALLTDETLFSVEQLLTSILSTHSEEYNR